MQAKQILCACLLTYILGMSVYLTDLQDFRHKPIKKENGKIVGKTTMTKMMTMETTIQPHNH